MLLEKHGPFSDPAYVFELKYDGFRMLAEIDAGQVRIQTRNGNDATSWFPEVTQCLATLPSGRHVLDGEVCVLDGHGRSDFTRLRTRAAMRGYRQGADPVVYVAFDLLVERGRDIMALPLLERKRRLRRLLAPRPSCVLVGAWVDGEHGEALYGHAVALKLEGVVAKKTDSPYVPGVRSPDWLKIKRPGVHDGWKREPL